MRPQMTDGVACLSLWKNAGMPKHPKRPEGLHSPTEKALNRWADEGGAPSGGRSEPPEEQGKDPVSRGKKGSGKFPKAVRRQPARSG